MRVPRWDPQPARQGSALLPNQEVALGPPLGALILDGAPSVLTTANQPDAIAIVGNCADDRRVRITPGSDIELVAVCHPVGVITRWGRIVPWRIVRLRSNVLLRRREGLHRRVWWQTKLRLWSGQLRIWCDDVRRYIQGTNARRRGHMDMRRRNWRAKSLSDGVGTKERTARNEGDSAHDGSRSQTCGHYCLPFMSLESCPHAAAAPGRPWHSQRTSCLGRSRPSRIVDRHGIGNFAGTVKLSRGRSVSYRSAVHRTGQFATRRAPARPRACGTRRGGTRHGCRVTSVGFAPDLPLPRILNGLSLRPGAMVCAQPIILGTIQWPREPGDA
jgi:hypothetical protein